LLGSVVQIALDAPAGGVGGGHDPGPRCGERGLDLGVGDGGGDQLGEPGQPRLGVGRQRLLAAGTHADPPAIGRTAGTKGADGRLCWRPERPGGEDAGGT
jgi:hypothetical protein